jgi:hypothetical protein
MIYHTQLLILRPPFCKHIVLIVIDHSPMCVGEKICNDGIHEPFEDILSGLVSDTAPVTRINKILPLILSWIQVIFWDAIVRNSLEIEGSLTESRDSVPSLHICLPPELHSDICLSTWIWRHNSASVNWISYSTQSQQTLLKHFQ